MQITARTRVIALLGAPVSHSLSPRIQNAAIQAASIDAVYVAVECTGDDCAPLLSALARAGGGGNVTVPHKQRAAAAVEAHTDAVARTGACNTYWLENGRVWGDNTDVAGFGAAVRTLIGSPAGARVLVVGAGGAARAVLCSLLDDHVDSVVVLNRTVARAEEIRATFAHAARRISVQADPAALRREGFDLVVNATSLGLHKDDALPLQLDQIHRVGAVFDLVYSPASTPLVRAAEKLGLRAIDGREMLLRQGAAAFERWFAVAAPLDAMRAALSTSSH